MWYGGGKLAADLSWPRLAQRWAAGQQPVPYLTAQERQQLWEYAASVAGHAAAQIRAWSLTSPEAAADAVWAAGDALRVTAAALGSRILRQAADGFDRAAREQYGRIPPPTPVGNRLRQAARLISAYGYLTHDKSFAPLKLIIQLAALAEAIASCARHNSAPTRPRPRSAPPPGSAQPARQPGQHHQAPPPRQDSTTIPTQTPTPPRPPPRSPPAASRPPRQPAKAPATRTRTSHPASKPTITTTPPWPDPLKSDGALRPPAAPSPGPPRGRRRGRRRRDRRARLPDAGARSRGPQVNSLLKRAPGMSRR